MESDASVHVELDNVSKRFGGVQALAEVNLKVLRGTIHGIVGENGAGKSTLGKIVAGVHSPDSGQLRVAGRAVHYRSPRDALADRITMIAQEISLVPARSVIENVFLGFEPNRVGVVSQDTLRERFWELNQRAGFGVPADAIVQTLRLADQQKVEILRALARDAELIVMDEPTASLTADEAAKLFEIVRGLNEQGTTIVYVSHLLQEVLSLVKSVTVLKDGRLIRTSPAVEESPETLVTAMIGRRLDLSFPQKAYPAPAAPVVFECRKLGRTDVLNDISFEIRAGEIVGLAGLVGSGRSEVVRAIFGADHLDTGGMSLGGKPVRLRGPRHAIDAGIALLPESRKDDGLCMDRSLIENVTLPHLSDVSTGSVLDKSAERARVSALLEEIDVRAEKPTVKVTTLSGGNQQKVLFAKWLFRRPRLLLADEPTRGVDVGAKQAIYALIHGLAADGMGVLLISSEHEEVIGLAHRVLVMRNGRLVAEFDGQVVSEDDVLGAAFATQEDKPLG